MGTYKVVVDWMAGSLHSQQIQVALLAMSPDCTTFSKVDSSNVTKGHNYRLHDKDHSTHLPSQAVRPPLLASAGNTTTSPTEEP